MKKQKQNTFSSAATKNNNHAPCDIKSTEPTNDKIQVFACI